MNIDMHIDYDPSNPPGEQWIAKARYLSADEPIEFTRAGNTVNDATRKVIRCVMMYVAGYNNEEAPY